MSTAVTPLPAESVTITRGCDTTVPFQTPVNCSTERTTGTPFMVGFTQTTSYTCSDSLCNVFTQTEAQSKLCELHPVEISVTLLNRSTSPERKISYINNCLRILKCSCSLEVFLSTSSLNQDYNYIRPACFLLITTRTLTSLNVTEPSVSIDYFDNLFTVALEHVQLHFSLDQLLYLPFDMTLEDHSAYMRNGYFWNSTMGGFTFDAFDKIKNKSALFDGMVNCFIVLDYLTQNMSELINPSCRNIRSFGLKRRYISNF